MRVRYWISTNKVGSKCEVIVDVDDEDANDDSALEDIGRETIWSMAEWGWEVLPD